jgi:hypothetical protein
VRLTHHLRVLALVACVAAPACARSAARGPSPAESDQTGGQYEVYNPTFCTAEVFTSSDASVYRQPIGQVPSGSRMVFTVPPLPRGVHLYATAVSPDGSDCERVRRVTVRRIAQ